MDLMRDESGSVMVEYALVLSLLSLAFISGMRFIDYQVSAALSFVQGELIYYALRNGS
jgi:Flp pilus assembly pilin Flp